MNTQIGNYARHAAIWDWGGHDRTEEFLYWCNYAAAYGRHVLLPFCALGECGAYMAQQGFSVTAFDIVPEMIKEGRKRFGDVAGLTLLVGDVTDFCFTTEPADFCYGVDFGHIHTVEELKKAIACIAAHLRTGGGLVIEADMPMKTSVYIPAEVFYPVRQAYPGKTVWKMGDTRSDAASGRRYFSQTVYMEDDRGGKEQFEHAFYMQSYPHAVWLAVLHEAGFAIRHEYCNGRKENWCNDDFLIIEAIKQEDNKNGSF